MLKHFKLTAMLAIGLVCLTLALTLTGYVFGLVPDAFRTELDARAKVAEALAIQVASGINSGEATLVENTLSAVVERNADVLSIAVRGADGAIIVSQGDHDAAWAPPTDGHSTPTHVRVPLMGESREQGTIEIAFGPASHAARIFGIPVSLLLFLGWMSASGFIGYAFLLRRSLKQLNPSRVIPERVRKAFDTLSEGVVLLDQRERILLANDAFAQLVGDAKAVAPGARFNALGWRSHTDTPTYDVGKGFHPWHAAIATGEDRRSVPVLLRGAGGDVYELHVNAARIANDGDKTMGAIVTVSRASHDIATRDALVVAQRQLNVARDQVVEARQALAHLRDHDAETGCLNRRAFTHELSDAATGTPLAVLAISSGTELADTHGTAFAHDALVQVGRALCATGGEHIIVARLGPVFAVLGRNTVDDVVRKVSDTARIATAALEDLRPELGRDVRLAQAIIGDGGADATLNALTARLEDAPAHQERQSHHAETIKSHAGTESGLARAAAMVDAHLGRGQAGTLLHVSIDSWTDTRDALGDDGARRLLHDIADRLRSACSLTTGASQAGVCVRFGEGACIVAVADPAGGDDAQLASCVAGALAEPVRNGRHDVLVSAHVGLAPSRMLDDDAPLLLHHARLAMRAAEEAADTRPWRTFHTDMLSRATHRLDVEAGIRSALRDDDFFLAYQPFVDLETGVLTGVEALIRCRSNALKGVYTDQIIAVAERSSLIARIDEWVLDAALKQMDAWCAAGVVVPKLSVNLSARQCSQVAFMDGVVERLGQVGFSLSRLQIEVTESAELSDMAVAAPQLKRLQQLGVHIAIDDFGTGQASLAYLQRLHPDVVKIDRSFVTDIHTDHASATMVTATTAMSHALGLRVIAEGVETSKELEFLRDVGCDEVQGYLISKPMPVDLITPWMELFIKNSTPKPQVRPDELPSSRETAVPDAQTQAA